MTRDVDAIRADLAARTVGGMASSAADRDIAALLGIIDDLQRSLATMDHFAEVAERTERRSNELHAELAQLRAAFGPCDINEATHYCRSHHQDLDIAGITCIEYAATP